MTYDEYTLKVRARVKKFRAFELWLKKHKAAVIAVTAVVFAAVLSVAFFSGSFIKGLSDTKFTYGEDTGEKAVSFLSGVSVSYTENGEEKTGYPTLAGEYDVTARTENPFGVKRQSTAKYVIEKRRATVRLNDFSVEYGEEPDGASFVAEGLADGDTAYITGIKYDRTTLHSDAEITGVVIKNGAGDDVTPSYELTFKGAEATVTKRMITIVTGSAEKIWDKEPITCNEYAFEYGCLAYDDRLDIRFFEHATEPKITANRAEVKIYDGDNDVTDRYAVTIKFGTLRIMRRKITVKTGSAEKEYDGEELYCLDYEVTYNELMDGHTLVLSDCPKIKNVGKIKNNLKFKVFEDGEKDVSSYYDIAVSAGTLTVSAREITVKTPSIEFQYDGTIHYPVDKIEITSGELYEDSTIQPDRSSGYLSAGEYKSKCSLLFGGSVPADAYSVTYDYGTVTVTKLPISMHYRVYGDAKMSDTHFVAVSDGEGAVLGAYDNFTSSSLNVEIPVNTDYDDFEDYIRHSIKIVNKATGAGQTNETGSYDITLTVEYDEDELDEFKANVTEIITENVTETGGETAPAETNVPETTKEAEKTPGEIYGENGIGSSGISGGISNSPSPYSSVPSETPELSPDPVGTVTSFMSGSVYLRLRSFGNYTGTGWAEPAIYTGKTENSPLEFTVNALMENGYAEMNDITVGYFANDALIPVPYYASNYYGDGYAVTDIAAARKAADGGSYYFFHQIPLVSVNVIKNLKGEARFNTGYCDFVYEKYLELPESTRTEILDIIKEAGLDPSSPSIITDVAEYVRNAARYNGSFEKIPDGEDRVIYFLKESKEGICGHFASAAVVIYRALGIPARYTVGYYVVCDGGFSTTEFYTKDAHAWAEIYLDSVGWVPVDATGSSVSEGGEGSGLTPPERENDIFYNKLYYRMEDASKKYDGKPLVSTEAVIVNGGNLKEGHRIEAVTAGITNCGTAEAVTVQFHVYDENGDDVTELYEITECGPAGLTVTPIIVFMPDISLYVGQTVKAPEYAQITEKDIAALIGDDRISFEFTSDQTLYVNGDELTGIAANREKKYYESFDFGTEETDGKTVRFTDGGEELKFVQSVTVLPFENVRVKDGAAPAEPADTLRITGENGKIYNYLSLRSSDASKAFDGEYLTSNGYEIISGALTPGHRIEYTGSAGVLYTGEKKNLFSSLCVLDEKDADVTGEYIIDFYPGTLTVYPGEYKMTDPAVTVSVDGEYDLSLLEWTRNVKNPPVTYESTGKEKIVRVQGGTVIGIEPGNTYIGSYLNGVDLNGDGVYEYLPVKKMLSVSVTPKQKPENTYIYIILIFFVSLAVGSVTWLMLNTLMREKEQNKDKRG